MPQVNPKHDLPQRKKDKERETTNTCLMDLHTRLGVVQASARDANHQQGSHQPADAKQPSSITGHQVIQHTVDS